MTGNAIRGAKEPYREPAGPHLFVVGFVISMVRASPGTAQIIYEALPPDSSGRVIYVPRGYLLEEEAGGPAPVTRAPSRTKSATKSTLSKKRAAQKSAGSAKAADRPAAEAAKPKSKAGIAEARPGDKTDDITTEPETTATTHSSARKVVEPERAEESLAPPRPPARRIIDPERPMQLVPNSTDASR